MGADSKIEWTDATINWWIGCTKVSAACDHCYAEAMASRFGLAKWGHGQQRQRVGSAVETAFKLDRKAQRQGRRLKVFSNSMSDFFDAEVPHEWRDEAFAVMALTPNLDWLILTKRPKVMREYMWSQATVECVYDLVCDMAVSGAGDAVLIAPGIDPSSAPAGTKIFLGIWPLPNVWLGVTAENQDMADLRIPELLRTPAAKRFVSVEPLLGPIDLSMHLDLYSYEEGHWAPRHPDGQPAPGIDWIICGSESGHGARPCDLAWVRSLRDQCAAAGVAFFWKQDADARGRKIPTPELDGRKWADLPR